MLRIGVTGGIGSGKSTVAELFATHGIAVIDADEIAHELLRPATAVYDAIVAHFGAEILDAQRHIDRARLRLRVFANANERKLLESLLHPRIHTRMQALAQKATSPYCLLVIPLLVEGGQRASVERVLVVDSPEEAQISRVMARSGLRETEVRAIMSAQATRAARLALADDVIVNDRDRAWLAQEVARLHSVYLRLCGNTINCGIPH